MSLASIERHRQTFHNDGNKLVGYVYKPKGHGPFPTVLWNHGSEENPDPGPDGQYHKLAEVFVPQGYVLFGPMRRGQAESEGKYIVDVVKKKRQKHGVTASHRLLVRLMETQQLDDQLAGLEHLKKLPYVDRHRIAVSGCSYGGIQTLLGAERGAGYKAAIAMSPGAESWADNEFLRRRLLKAARTTDIPVLLIHPKQDASVRPGYELGKRFERHHKPYGLIVFPPYGSSKQQQHCFGGLSGGPKIWGPSVVEFLKAFV